MEQLVNLEREEVRMQALVCERSGATELASDLYLPDYQPEIKRFLRVRAVATPPDTYLGGGNCELSGTVDYTVLYAGEDGSLYSASKQEPYRLTCPVEMGAEFDVRDGLTVDAEVSAESVGGRATGPRRFSVRSRLRFGARFYGTKCLEDPKSDPLRTQTLVSNAETARIYTGKGEVFHLADEVLTDGKDSLRAVSAEGQVVVTEATAMEDAVECRGEVLLTLLCVDDETNASLTLSKRVPFREIIPVEGATPDSAAIAKGICLEIGIQPENGRLLADLSAVLLAWAYRNEEIPFVKDLYTLDAPVECTYKTEVIPRFLGVRGRNFSVNEVRALKDVGIRSGASVADVCVDGDVTAIDADARKTAATGVLHVHAVLQNEGDYASAEFDLPFRLETDGIPADLTFYRANLTPYAVRAHVDGEKIYFSCEVAANFALFGSTEAVRLTDVETGEAVSENSVFHLCYPAAGDTLWNVAKKYRRPVEEISEKNGLKNSLPPDSPDSLAGVKFLLI